MIMDSASRNVVATGRMKQGLYFLQSEEQGSSRVAMIGQRSQVRVSTGDKKLESEFALWHSKVGARINVQDGAH